MVSMKLHYSINTALIRHINSTQKTHKRHIYIIYNSLDDKLNVRENREDKYDYVFATRDRN